MAAYPKGEMRCGLELSVGEVHVLIDLCHAYMHEKGPTSEKYDLWIASAARELVTVAEMADRLYSRKPSND